MADQWVFLTVDDGLSYALHLLNDAFHFGWVNFFAADIDDFRLPAENANVLAKSNRLAKQTTINGMNHILKMVSGSVQEQISSYRDPSLPIAEELVEEITSFMMSVETTRPNKACTRTLVNSHL